MKRVVLVLVVLAVVGVSPCFAREKVPLYLGLGVFTPTSSETRAEFGKTWPQFTVGRLETEYPDKWVGTWDLTSIRRSSDADAWMLAFTVGVRRGIGAYRTDELEPYAAVRVGPYYGTVDPDKGSSDSKVGLNANASLGVLIQKRYFVEGRYDQFGKIGGFNLNGLSIWAGVKILDL